MKRIPDMVRSMSLVVSTPLVIGLTLMAVFGGSLAVSLGVLGTSFRQFERLDVESQERQVKLLFHEELDGLQGNVADYAQWDDLIEYLDGRHAEFLASNLTAEQFGHIDIDAVVLLAPDGSTLFEGGRAGLFSGVPRADGLVALPEGESHAWALLPGLLSSRKPTDVASGALVLNGKAYLAAFSPVLPTNGTGQSRGILVMAKLLSEGRLAGVEERVSSHLRFVRPGEKTPPGVEFGETSWSSHVELRGLLREPGLGFFVQGERRVLAQLHTSRVLLAGNIAAMTLACFLLVAVVLHRMVLRRIRRFSRLADAMRRDPSADQLPVTGNDELDRLARSTNELISELRQTQDRHKHDALHDALTGLGNRAMLEQRLTFLDALAVRDATRTYAIYLLDLDGFKKVNDMYGHPAGDFVLREAARRISDEVRDTDLVARIGGDEFVVVVVPAPHDDARSALGHRLLSSVRQPMPWEGHELRVSASVGIAAGGHGQGRGLDLLRDADNAMYTAKEAGCDQVTEFGSALREQLRARLELEGELRAGIERGELEVWYQPIVDGRTGRVAAAESLVRWRHPKRGLVFPDAFVPLAEESNLILALDRAVLRKAIFGLARLRQIQPELSLAVNVSVGQLLLDDLHEFVTACLREAHVPASALALEVTETGFARDEGRILPAITPLLDTGVKLHLDDFGMGYSSLNRLLQLPVHALKIDRSFVSRLDDGYGDIVEAMVKIGHAIGKEVVAEGVETAREHARLVELGCEYLQGYYFAKPAPEAQFTEFLKRERSHPKAA